jgi:hypothetical protein
MDATQLSLDELRHQVKTWAARISRGTAELLDLIGEMDAREAWGEHGATSCAQWLSWQLGWCDTTSREHVRVARALRGLPLIRQALHDGELSYSQARGVTRIATPDEEQKWLTLARTSTGAQLDKIARGAERARAADTPEPERPVKRAALVEWDGDGDLVLTLRIPAHEALPVLEVLEQLQKVIQGERDEALKELLETAMTTGAGASAEADQLPLPTVSPDGQHLVSAEPPVGASAEASAQLAAADARGHDPLQPYPYVEPPYPIGPNRLGFQLTASEEAALEAWEVTRQQARELRDAWNDRREQLLLAASAAKVPTGKATLADALVRAVTAPADGPKTTVQLLVDPLSGWARTQHDELLPPATLAKVLDTLPRKRTRRGPVAVTQDLTRYDQGRDGRLVSPALRALLGQLDGERCRFPGCRHTRFLHAHHIRYWRNGGRTDLSNLLLLCTRHHRLIHSLGYELVLDTDRRLRVTTADGTVLEHMPALPSASAEALPPAPPLTEPGYDGSRFDLGYAVHVMLQHAA